MCVCVALGSGQQTQILFHRVVFSSIFYTAITFIGNEFYSAYIYYGHWTGTHAGHTLLPLVLLLSFIVVIFLMNLFELTKKLLCVFDWVFHHFHFSTGNQPPLASCCRCAFHIIYITLSHHVCTFAVRVCVNMNWSIWIGFEQQRWTPVTTTMCNESDYKVIMLWWAY